MVQVDQSHILDVASSSSESVIEPPSAPAQTMNNLLANSIARYWPQMAFGISAAGGAYPVVLATVGVCIATYSLLFFEGNVNASEIAEAAFMLIAYTLIATLAGMAYAAVACLVTAPIVYLFVRSLELHGSTVRLGAYWGGFVGFAAVLPLFVTGPMNDPFGGAWQFTFWLALGPCLTTCLGQLGGAWGGRLAERKSDLWYLRQVDLASVPVVEPPINHPAAARQYREIIDKRFQFGIRHLMWISLWSSLLMMAIRLSGVPFEYMLPLFFGWLLIQAVTMKIGGWLLPRIAIARRRKGQQTRST
jgi:hypothetical protein